MLVGGELNPGDSPGTFTVHGDVTLQDTTELNFELGPGGLHDLLNIDGNFDADGIFSLLLAGYSPQAGDAFPLITWTGILSGGFDTINLPSLAGGYYLTSSWNLDAKDFRVQVFRDSGAVPEPEMFLLTGLSLVALCAVLRRSRRRAIQER